MSLTSTMDNINHQEKLLSTLCLSSDGKLKESRTAAIITSAIKTAANHPFKTELGHSKTYNK